MAATIDGKPITKFTSHDEGYVQVVNAVSRAIANMEAKKPQQSTYAPAPENPMFQATDTVWAPRSSNLSLPKRFTDLDKDRACRDGFEYVARYFERSLAELKKRYAGLEVDFHKRDADAFTCAIYMGGSKVGQCAIWRASGRNMGVGDIAYSQDGTIGNTYNESLTIDDNGQILGFHPLMGVFGAGSSREALLTNEGMAEHLWDMFFEPIKQRAR